MFYSPAKLYFSWGFTSFLLQKITCKKIDGSERSARDYPEAFKLLESTGCAWLGATARCPRGEASCPSPNSSRLVLLGLAELLNGEVGLLQPVKLPEGLKSCSGRASRPQELLPPGLEERPNGPTSSLSAGTSAGGMVRWRQSVGTRCDVASKNKQNQTKQQKCHAPPHKNPKIY